MAWVFIIVPRASHRSETQNKTTFLKNIGTLASEIRILRSQFCKKQITGITGIGSTSSTGTD